jgi:hypothetical protein
MNEFTNMCVGIDVILKGSFYFVPNISMFSSYHYLPLR